jgi:S-DNA-T family DNA segregation ATPase FtsK/SpoIIIE
MPSKKSSVSGGSSRGSEETTSFAGGLREVLSWILPESTSGRLMVWLAAGAAWVLAVAALASFHAADWPSHVVAVHNDPARNLVGGIGAWTAYWSYAIFGLGAWIPLLFIGVALGMVATGRDLTHPLVRSLGVALMMLAIAGLHAHWFPSLGVLTGADAGMLPQWIADQFFPRFGGFGTSVVLLLTLAVGALVAMDEVVLALPAALTRTFGFLEPVLAFDWAGSLAKFRGSRTAAPVPVAAGGPVDGWEGATVVDRTREADVAEAEEEEDEEEEVDQDDELESSDDEEVDAEGDENEDAEDDADESGVAVIDEDEHDEEELEEKAYAAYEKQLKAEEARKAKADAKAAIAAATPPTPVAADAEKPGLTDEELRAKIARLPVKMASGQKVVARDEDIPRPENYEGYRFPTLELLEDPEGNFSQKMESFVREQAQVLEQTLRTFQIEGEVVGIESGPVVTLYSVELAPGTRVARLETIAKDIARSLQAPNIRIIANMVGRTAVGIEVPNRTKEKVRLKELMSGGQSEGMTLPMFLGKDSAGEPVVLDLARMPHMLIAGTTGSGKSVCMNTIIMSWLYTKRPDELKLVLVDPKMVEMAQFSDIPHLMAPVITDMSKAAGILEWAVNKMEERYELLKGAGVRDIKGYNELDEAERYARFDAVEDAEKARVPRKLPYMVFVIDELADLMMTHKEVEHSIVRIAQKARAVGIHLILATQRPQANVVTGLIKSNMPCRISFKVASGMDSRIVLDQKGAELLLGHGDMMVVTPSSTDIRRCQGTLVTDGETRKVSRFLKDIATPSFERSLLAIRGASSSKGEEGGGEGGGEPDDGERDPLFEKAVEIMIESGRGSVSLLQRRLAIGYGRASRLVDQMGLAGILGEHKGSVAREVVITLDDWHRMKAMHDQSEGGEDGGGVPDEFEGEYRN